MKFFLGFVLSFSLFPVWAKGPSHCLHLSQDTQILSCLNEFANAHLSKGSQAEVKFREKMERHSSLYDLNLDQMPFTPLDEYFRIVVDKKSLLKGESKNKTCFHFSKNAKSRRHQILNIENQIVQLASFLADFHSQSLGRQISLLFPIKEVSVCSIENNGDRPMAFRKRRLHFGVDMNSEAVYTADTLMEIWNAGNPIRVSDKNPIVPQKVRTIYHGLNKDLDAIFRDKLADSWHILNPVSEKRLTAVSIIMEIIQKSGRLKNLLSDLGHDQELLAVEAYNKMMSTVQGPGFTQRHFDLLESLQHKPHAIVNLYRRWLQKMNDAQTIASMLETGMIQNSQGSEIVIMAREQSSLLASYANSHEISVDIGQLLSTGVSLSQFDEQEQMRSQMPQEELTIVDEGLFSTKTLQLKFNHGTKLHTNMDDTTGLLFAGNTSDVINVKLKLPRISFPTYKRAALFEVLEEGPDYLN